MAQSRAPLEDSALDEAIANSRQAFDPDREMPADPDEGDEEQYTGHPAQATETADPSEGEQDPAPPAPPVTPTPPEPPVAPVGETEAVTERRRLEAERRMHLATESEAKVRADYEKLTTEIDALKTKISEAEPTAAGKERATITAARQKLQAKIQEMTNFEASDPNYWDKLGNTWADGLDPLVRAIADEAYQVRSKDDRDALINDISERVFGKVTEQQAAEQARLRVYNDVVSKAEKFGFDVREGSEDWDDFWGLAADSVDRKMPNLTIPEKAKESIKVFCRLKGVAFDDALYDDASPQRAPTPMVLQPPVTPSVPPPVRPQPMRRATAGPPVLGQGEEVLDDSPQSLDDMIKQTVRQRRA